MTVSHLGAKKNVPAYSESSLLGQVKKDIEQDCLLQGQAQLDQRVAFCFCKVQGLGVSFD